MRLRALYLRIRKYKLRKKYGLHTNFEFCFNTFPSFSCIKHKPTGRYYIAVPQSIWCGNEGIAKHDKEWIKGFKMCVFVDDAKYEINLRNHNTKQYTEEYKEKSMRETEQWLLKAPLDQAGKEYILGTL